MDAKPQALTTRRLIWAATIGLTLVPLAVMAVVLIFDERTAPPSNTQPESVAKLARASRSDEGDAGRRRNVPRARPLPRPPVTQTAPPTAAMGASVADKLEEARRAENTNPALARDLLEEVLAIDPQNEVALRSLSTKLFLDEKQGRARELASRCLGVTPGAEDCAAIDKSILDENDPETRQLIDFSKDCMAKTPDNGLCAYVMIDYHLNRGDHNEAALLAGRLSHAHPEHELTQLAQARIKSASGKYTEARPLLDRACSLENEQACLRSRLLQAEGF